MNDYKNISNELRGLNKDLPRLVSVALKAFVKEPCEENLITLLRRVKINQAKSVLRPHLTGRDGYVSDEMIYLINRIDETVEPVDFAIEPESFDNRYDFRLKDTVIPRRFGNLKIGHHAWAMRIGWDCLTLNQLKLERIETSGHMGKSIFYLKHTTGGYTMVNTIPANLFNVSMMVAEPGAHVSVLCAPDLQVLQQGIILLEEQKCNMQLYTAARV
jgi:hypothetical protein